MARIRLNLLLSAAYHGFKTGKGADHLIVMGVSLSLCKYFQRQPQAVCRFLLRRIDGFGIARRAVFYSVIAVFAQRRAGGIYQSNSGGAFLTRDAGGFHRFSGVALLRGEDHYAVFT